MPGLRIVGLFAGIGGIETGFRRALGERGLETTLLCESWAPARAVLETHFDVEVHADVRTLRTLPSRVDVVAAGFPCTDLSQAGRTAGIQGRESGLVSHVFEMLEVASRRRRPVKRLLVENVPNMLSLDRGEAMAYLVSELERLGYRWAYRVVDSRFTGVPQRRRRVILLASRVDDPRDALFVDDDGDTAEYSDDAFGFYWTEGRGGLGWAQDAVPTLKGGSTVGIPSPPAIWVRGGDPGKCLVMPSISDAEELQGFDRGWTEAADGGGRNGPRWKLVGNAVTVGVSKWIAERIVSPGVFDGASTEWSGRRAWPTAAWGESGRVFTVDVSEFPVRHPYRHLGDVVDLPTARPVSHRGVRGFWSRLSSGNLGQFPGFREAVVEHVEITDPARDQAELALAARM